MTIEITIQDAFDYALSKNPTALLSHISKIEKCDYFGTESVQVFLNYIDENDEDMSNGHNAWIAVSEIEDFLNSRDNTENNLKNDLCAYISEYKIPEGRNLVNIESYREVIYQNKPAYLVRYNWNSDIQPWKTGASAIVKFSELNL